MPRGAGGGAGRGGRERRIVVGKEPLLYMSNLISSSQGPSGGCVICPILEWKGGTERSSNLPKPTQLVKGQEQNLNSGLT